MHLIVRESTSMDEIGEPQDLGLDPADFILLSFSDSDLSTFRAAINAPLAPALSPREEGGRDRCGSVPSPLGEKDRMRGSISAHFINLASLRHPISADLFIDKTLPGTKAIVLRLLGGLDYWRYGAEELAHACRKHGVTLAVLPGDGRADLRLPVLSTLDTEELDVLGGLVCAGGPRNAGLAISALLARAGGARITQPSTHTEPPPEFGIYRQTDGRHSSLAAIVFYRSYLLADDLRPIDGLADALESQGLGIRAYYVPSLKAPGVAAWLREELEQQRPGVIVNTTAFSARGEDGKSPLDSAGCPVIQAAMAGSSEEAWRASSRGLSAADLAMHVVLPELDGRLFAGAVSFKDRDAAGAVFHQPQPQGIEHTARLASAWARLRRTPREVRKLALVLSTYPGRPDQIAHAVGLDGPESALRIARHLERAGYVIETLPSDAPGLLSPFLNAQPPSPQIQLINSKVPPHPVLLPEGRRDAVDRSPQSQFGRSLSQPSPLADMATQDGKLAKASLRGERQSEGVLGTVRPDLAHPISWSIAGYEAAFARLPPSLCEAVLAAWGAPDRDPAFASGAIALPISRHGNLFIGLQPERGFLTSRKSGYHDLNLPPRHAYIAFYLWLRQHAAIDALIHLGAHGTLEWLPGKAAALSEACTPRALLGPVPVIYPFIVNDPGEAAQAKRRIAAVTVGHNTPPLVETSSSPVLREVERLADEYSAADGLDKKRRDRLARDILDSVAKGGLEEVCGIRPEMTEAEALMRVDAFLCDVKALAIRDGLHVLDGIELDAILRACDGRFIEPGPSGAPSRGRADVLPTGRNLYSIDPRTIPTRLACENGARMADAIVARYAEDHGDWPRSLVLDLWGSQTMRTGGEEIGTALALLGVKPIWDPQSFRLTGFEIVPLMKLNRPRVDVTLRISGLLRDMFPAQLAFFHAAVQRVVALEEEASSNPLCRHRGEIYRVFGAADGAYGAGVTERIEDGDWQTRDDLAGSYLAASSTAYSGDGKGIAARGAFEQQVKEASGFVHVQDHRETDILSSLDFAAHEGGFAAAASALGNADAAIYHADTGAPEAPRVRSLQEEAARVLHGRAVSGRWLEGQMRHGFAGAAQIASTMDSAYALAATAGAVSSEGFEHLYEAYLSDPTVAGFLARENGAALSAIQSRFKEAIARSLWRPRRNDLSGLEGSSS
jgi:cobaltochelatase CobN